MRLLLKYYSDNTFNTVPVTLSGDHVLGSAQTRAMLVHDAHERALKRGAARAPTAYEVVQPDAKKARRAEAVAKVAAAAAAKAAGAAAGARGGAK